MHRAGATAGRARMKALILAAGRGERMRPLTDTTPKPLLVVRGKRLIEWHIESLVAQGITDIVINTAWLGEEFPVALGTGARYGARISYSMEGQRYGGALETAGGMATALPLLGDAPFALVNGDVFAPGFRFDAQIVERFMADDSLLAHLLMVPNPPQHANGDFGISAQGLLLNDAATRYTYSGLALYRPEIVRNIAAGERAPLLPLLRLGAALGRISASLYSGEWHDVGTPQRLDALNRL